jgi:hypothetical protein
MTNTNKPSMPTESRGISRIPIAPELSPELIDLLTTICFIPDSPFTHVNTVFAFGYQLWDQEVSKLKLVISSVQPQTVIISGGLPKFVDSTTITQPESLEILSRLNPAAFPDINFLTETRSSNTKDNILNSLNLHDFSKERQIFYLTMEHVSGRTLRTLKQYLPNTELLQASFSSFDPMTKIPLSKEQWYLSENGRNRVWGEYLRIKEYGQKGDLLLDTQTRDIIEKIDQKTKTASNSL